MALNEQTGHPAPPRTMTFVRLKLRILGNGFRGRPSKVILLLLAIAGGLFYGGLAMLGFAAALGTEDPGATAMVPALAGSAFVLGWLLVPLVWSGVDDTLDPARFALLPLPRRVLLRGLLAAAMIGVPAAATLLATSGLVIGTMIAGGPLPALASAVGVLLGLVLCVTVSRAVTSGFSRALRARRTRDLAAVVLALLAASIGPMQMLVTSGASKLGTSRFEVLAEVLGWTPLGAPYALSTDALAGRWAAVGLKVLIVLAAIAALMWWWGSSLESAMLGTAGGGGPARTKGPLGSPVTRLLGRSRLPRTPYGALTVRELRYWMRDARRRASLITFAVLAVFLPVMLNLGPAAESGPSFMQGPVMQALTMLFIGSLAAVGLANQFGFDGTAYAANLVIGVPGRLELRSRVTAFSVLVVPVLVVLAVLACALRGNFGQLPLLLGALGAAYGTGLAASVHISVWAAYSLPENQNPFAVNTGAGVAKSLLAMVAWGVGMALALPLALPALIGGAVGSAIALPLGLAYGLGAAWLGLVTAGNVLDRRQPELLQAVTPRG